MDTAKDKSMNDMLDFCEQKYEEHLDYMKKKKSKKKKITKKKG